MRKNNHNKRKLSIIALALVCCMAVAGVSAYFTDADTATNTFTIGKISLDLQEPSWTPPEDITPNEEFAKDPQIKNDGINEEYVFLKVEVPYATVVTANADGTKNEPAAVTELFSYTVNSGWTEFKTAEKSDADENGCGTVTHYYAYGTDSAMTALAANATTPALFDAVKFANVVEDQGLEGASKDIVLYAYGIQTTNINNGDSSADGTNTAGKTAPVDVWEVVANENPSTDVGVEENANTDIKNSN